MYLTPTLQVGADRFLRLWDSVSGACLGERFTGHRMGETVTALGQSLDNTRLVTGDSYGFIKVEAIVAYVIIAMETSF
jgi:hypothetical protein